MARPKIPENQKKREGSALLSYFLKAQQREPELTQESIIAEMGLASQGLFFQWCDGRTNIPDRRLIWLGERLKFNPDDIRPSLKDYAGSIQDDSSELSKINGSLSEGAKADLLKYARLLESSESNP